MCLTDLREGRTPKPRLTWRYNLTFYLHFSQETVLRPAHCSSLYECVCVWFSDRAKPPLSRNVDTWADTGALKCCWGVKTLFTDWISLCHVVARCPLHTFSCDFFQCWRDSIEHESAEAVDLFKVYWHLVWFFPLFFKKMLCLRSQCGLNGVPTQRVLEEEEREEEGGDGALWRLSVCCVYCQTLKDLQALSSALSST